MKSILQYITEKIKISDKDINNIYNHKYKPNNKEELVEIIHKKFKKNDFDLTDIDVSNITNFSTLFKKARFDYLNTPITYIDVSGWNTSNVTTMMEMFSGLNDLQEIIGLDTWDVSKVENFHSVFAFCSNLKELNLTGWDISSGGTFRDMFNNCYALEKIIGIENFKFGPNVSMISYMFSGCENLKTIDLSKWDVKNVKWFSGLFFRSGIEHIDLRDWETTKLYSAVAMFQECENLKSCLGLETWDLSECVDLNHMFCKCYKLETIGNCKELNLTRVLSTENMFENCENLVLDASKWIYYKRCKRTNMFRYTSRKIIKK